MKAKKGLFFIITFVLTLGIFLLNSKHNSFSRLGIYEFVDPTLLSLAFSFLITVSIFNTHPAVIGGVLLLCLLANAPPSLLGSGIPFNQDVLFCVLVVLLFLPVARRWIEL